MTAPPASTPTTWRALCCGLLLFGLADTAVFRSGAYAWLAKPDSSAGWIALRTRFEPTFRPSHELHSILLLGDSSMCEAANADDLRAQLGEPLLSVHNAGVPGSTPRVWPFLFSALEPPPAGNTIVVTGLREFDDDAEAEDLDGRAHDLSFLGPLLDVQELLAMAREFEAGNARRDACLMALCQSYAWRRDLQDLFAAPWTRFELVRQQFGRMRWGQRYEGKQGSLAGVHVEGEHIVGLPPGSGDAAGQLEQLVWRRDCVDNSRYRRRWLGELAERVVASGAQLVFVRLPSQVLPRARPRVPNSGVLDELAQRPGVHVLAFDLFAELDAPEFFSDALHVNRIGRDRFSQKLATELRRRFGTLLGR